MPAFNVKSSTLASSIDAIAKTYRNDKGRLWTSNILPSHDVRSITVRAFDGHGQTDHKCWTSFDIKELMNGSEVSASFCTKAHKSVKLRDQVFEQLIRMYPTKSGDDDMPPLEDIDAVKPRWSLDEATVPGDSSPIAPIAADAGAEQAAPIAPQPAPVPAAPPETLEAALERIAQLERGLTDTNSAARHIHKNIQTTTQQVQVVDSRIRGILSNLEATLGYRGKTAYVCASCHSTGKVAVSVKCTQCGQENWWGWWPSGSHDDSPDDEDPVHWLWQRLR